MVKQRLAKLVEFVAKRATRAATANMLMASFIIMTSIGAFYIDISAGFITLGVASGVLGFLLGLE
jgi:hypothetical protein